ncbi:MAG: hypothetical protein N3F67_00190 [Acidilobaceae archaeon]|nr:hypothetical protein [Acidilobaceae archaeon]
MNLKEEVARSFEALRFYVADRRAVRTEEVEELLRAAGSLQVVLKAELGKVVVYYIDATKARRTCLYSECAGKEGLERERCLRECSLRLEEKLAKEVAAAIRSL